MIRTKRIYERPESDDGYRVLVDRLWPRGLTKEKAEIDEWLKEVAPSDGLRRWFHDNPDRWADFKASYTEELMTKSALLDKISKRSFTGRVTLLYSRHDEEHNQAVVIKEFLEERRSRAKLGSSQTI